MRKTSYLIIGLLVFTAIYSCKNNQTEEESVETEQEVVEVEKKEIIKQLSLALTSKSDSKAEGKVLFEEKDGVVTMTARLFGLSPGTHAIHIHEKADCTAADGTSAGGHWNPTFKPHGAWGAESGYHKGDIGNFEAGEDGKGNVTFSTNEWCLGCDDEAKNVVGKSIIVHQGEDDLTSQPSGAAGARVSCGGIIE